MCRSTQSDYRRRKGRSCCSHLASQAAQQLVQQSVRIHDDGKQVLSSPRGESPKKVPRNLKLLMYPVDNWPRNLQILEMEMENFPVP
ncbi:hypothetical protein Tco_0465149 [Tanacetum coccineum]